MGNSLSGWHGRRSRRPYLDDMARLSIGECKAYAPGLIWFSVGGRHFTARVILVTVGCLTVPRFVCPTCDQVCSVLYVGDTSCCRRCAGARYSSQSKSPRQRALSRAQRILDQFKKAVPGRSGKKPKWMRLRTYKRHKDVAKAVLLTIVAAAEGRNKAFQSSIVRIRRLARTTKGGHY